MIAIKKALLMRKIMAADRLFRACFALLVLADSHRLVWAALCLAGGVLLQDHIPAAYLAVVLAGLCCLAGAGAFLRCFSLACGLLAVAAGMLASETEIRTADHLMLDKAVTTTITGIIEKRAARDSNRLALTLTDVSSPDPALLGIDKVRFTTDDLPFLLLPGDRIQARVRLFALSPPSFAGRPDYARNQYMSGLTATGFAYQTSLQHANADTRPGMRLNRWRHRFAAEFSERMGPAYGGVAAALLVGVREDISGPVYDAFRASGLAHLLAISGLHMGLFCLSVLVGVRAGFACFPSLCQRWSPRRFAALAALFSGFAYLLISGGPVSAIRAFVMAVIILLAVLADRPAFTLRNLALAAICLLVLSPSVLYSAGFQMSFAASFAIIAGIEALRDHTPANRLIRAVFLILLTSALASVVTVPFVAYHFGQFTLWGIAANLIAIPLTTFLIMPAGILVLLGAPFGLSGLADGLMVWPIAALLATDDLFAGLPFAGIFMPPPPVGLLGLFFGALVSLFTPGRLFRLCGGLGLVLCLVLWAGRETYQAAVFFARGPVLAIVTPAGEIQTSVPVSPWWQDNLRLSLGREVVTTAEPPMTEATVILVTRRRQLSAACDSMAETIITLAEPLYACRSGRQLVYLPVTDKNRNRESWLISSGGTDEAVPMPLSNLHHQRRPWRHRD